MSTSPNPAPADDEAPLPGGWRGALQTAPLWIPSSGGALLGVLAVILALAAVVLAVLVGFGSDESADWLPGGLRSGWVVVVVAALALGLGALRRTDLVWLWLRILRRDVPTAVVATATILGVALVAVTGGAADGDSGAMAATTPVATTATATETPSTLTPSPTPTATPDAATTSTPISTPAVAIREPAPRPFALEALTFDEVCAPPGRVVYQCGVLPLGAGIARLIESYVGDSSSAEARSCNLRSYDVLVQETLALNALAIDDTVQGDDVFVLPPLPCSDPSTDRGELDTGPAEAFLEQLSALLGSFADSWANPAPSDLDAIAAPEAHDALVDVLDHFRDRYDGRPVEISSSPIAYAIDGDYYLLRVTFSAVVADDSGCSAHRHRWFALVEIDPTGHLGAVGDARFTSPFSASELCGG